MTINPFNIGSTPSGDRDAAMMPAADPTLIAELLEPRLTERPAPSPRIEVPKSMRRTYSPTDLSVAGDLMAKLRRRDDQRPLAARAAELARADRAVDVAIDRLMRVL